MFSVLLSLSLVYQVHALFADCSISENWGDLLSSFENAGTYSTVDYFEIVGTITVPTGSACPTSFRAFQTIEAAPSINCLAAPIEVVGGGSSVETVTYIYQECPVRTEAFGPVVTVNESHWVQTDSEGGSIFGFTSSIVTLTSLTGPTITVPHNIEEIADNKSDSGSSSGLKTTSTGPTPTETSTSVSSSTGLGGSLAAGSSTMEVIEIVTSQAASSQQSPGQSTGVPVQVSGTSQSYVTMIGIYAMSFLCGLLLV